ncbi:uncharacterized protein LOC116086221 [Mastomys coucha]|uniref:uncharacterized protein LOC116086221 n=1 Tax=Mastomys coucha TaxID=35658 RepID=UPI0012616873|nr:uncharacterized protein LOC116086221 [Mastomys coucha]
MAGSHMTALNQNGTEAIDSHVMALKQDVRRKERRYPLSWIPVRRKERRYPLSWIAVRRKERRYPLSWIAVRHKERRYPLSWIPVRRKEIPILFYSPSDFSRYREQDEKHRHSPCPHGGDHLARQPAGEASVMLTGMGWSSSHQSSLKEQKQRTRASDPQGPSILIQGASAEINCPWKDPHTYLQEMEGIQIGCCSTVTFCCAGGEKGGRGKPDSAEVWVLCLVPANCLLLNL